MVSAAVIFQDEIKEGRLKSHSAVPEESTYSLKEKIRALGDSVQKGDLSFDGELFCKWICSYQA